jgi:hypothetical protein
MYAVNKWAVLKAISQACIYCSLRCQSERSWTRTKRGRRH